jgi:hypothetical protein
MVPGSCLVSMFVCYARYIESLRQEWLKSEAINGCTLKALAERSSGLKVFFCKGRSMFAKKQEVEVAEE